MELIAAVYTAVKIVSIMDPSFFVTVHVRVPQLVRPRELVTSASVQLRVVDASLMKYVKAGVAIGNFAALIVNVSRRHLLMTSMLKSCVAEITVCNS